MNTELTADTEVKKSKPVLLVEDDIIIGDLLQKIMGRFGYAGHLVATLESAKIELEKKEYVLVISDTEILDSPRGGWELLSHVRKHWPQLPFILMTGRITEGRDIAHENRAAFLEKPFNIPKLKEKIAEAFELAQIRSSRPPEQ